MSNSWNRREVIGIGGATALAAAVGASGARPAAGDTPSTDSPISKLPGGDPQSNKQLLREHREASQRRALPSALPGEENQFDIKAQSPLVGFTPKFSMVSNDSPITPTTTPEARALIQGGFASQALGPTFISFGQMLAEGEHLVEEWESQIYGANGTLYNNQYLVILRFEGDQLSEFHEYNDSQHAALIFGPLGKWPELKPPTHPRRRNRHGVAPPVALPESEVETVFEVTDKFDLNPRMLGEVIPSASAAAIKVQPGIEGNKALVRALRHARAAGDQKAVNSFFAPGYRHWIGGEKPFGWDHLPLREIYAPLVKHLASPLTLRYGPMIAAGGRVFEQMDSFARLDDGTVYNNWHAFIHEIRDGKIVQTREYHDSRHVWVVLGRWAPWGATPVPARSRPRRSNLQGIYATVQYPTTLGPDLERWQPIPAEPG
jgi:ketosteroid isomerase-like protein